MSDRKTISFSARKNQTREFEKDLVPVPVDLKRVTNKHLGVWEDRMEMLCEDHGESLLTFELFG